MGDNILVAYDYPIEYSLQIFEDVARSVRKVPVEMAASLAWISKQEWADSH